VFVIAATAMVASIAITVMIVVMIALDDKAERGTRVAVGGIAGTVPRGGTARRIVPAAAIGRWTARFNGATGQRTEHDGADQDVPAGVSLAA